MLTDAANYVTRTTFATPADVHSMSRGIESPHSSTLGVPGVWMTVDVLGIQVPMRPVVRRVSNMVLTFNTRSAKPGSPAISSATRSSEWMTVE